MHLSLQIAVEGSHYVGFKMLLRIHAVKLAGTLLVSSTPDLRTIRLSFAQPPELRMRVECTVAWVSATRPFYDIVITNIVWHVLQ